MTIRGDSKVNLQTHVFDAKINADISDFTSFIPKLAPIIDFKKIKMENAEYLNFSADISGNYNNLSTLNFLSTLNAKKIKIHDIMIDEITSELKFKNSTLIIPELKLKNKDMTLNARLTYLINEKIISSELILNGKPPELSLIGELFPSIKENIRDFPKIEFSYQPEDNSIKMQIFIRFMPELFYFVDSNLMLKNLIYDKNHIDKVNASVLISSDKIIAISGGHIEKDGGYCNFELIHNESFFDLSKPLTPSLTNNVDGENSQYISFSAKSNNIPAELLLKLIPYFQLEWLSFYGALNTALDGVIDLEHTINSSIKGKISGENAKIANLSLNDFSANIEFNRHVLSIEQLNAIFYQGVFNGNFHYDFQKDLGDIKVQIKNSNFHQILKDIQNTPSDYIGLLSLKLKSKIYSQNSKLLFNGGGSFLITDCKILNIPILYELIQVIGTKYLDKDWAQIDTINADFKLNDTIIRSDKIETNGNIIALEGSGYYNWYEDYCDFNVRVKPFQELFPMRILSPITNRLFSILELKYSGKKGKRRWTPTSGIFNN